jgi:UDP-glucose 4-epimerase
MKILITGGSGFIGSYLCKNLLEQGHEVISLDNFSTGKFENIAELESARGFKSIEGSILDEELVKNLISSVDSCFHFAAAVGVQKILDDPIGSLKTNLHGSENVIQACSESKINLVLASTSEIYGKNPSQPLTEDSDRVIGSPLLSRWTYSEAKAIDEALAHAYHSKHGLKVKIVRLFNTVGPRQSPAYGMVIPRFFAAALAGKDLEIHGDGSQRRVFCHVDDAVNGVIELWKHSDGNGEAFNIGGVEEISILNLAKKIIEVTKSNSKINFIPYEKLKTQGFEDMQRRVPSTEKLRELIGWAPKKGLDEILFDYLSSARK